MNRAVLGLLGGCLALLLAACGPGVRPMQEPAPDQAPIEVLVVRLDGVLGTREIALCHRGLRLCEETGMQLVFRLDYAGGIAESSSDVQGLLDHLQGSGAVTTAVLSGEVRGGAAYLALLCDQLFFLRGGTVGAVTPMASTWEQLQELSDEDAQRQRYRAYGEEMVRRLQQRKNKLSANAVRLCEGMADPALRLVRVTVREGGLESTRIVAAEELTALQAAGVQITSQTEVTQPVVLTADEAAEVGISSGQVQSMEQLCSDVLLVDERLVGELEYSWAEDMVGWLELLQPALLILGFVLLVLEIKTPGLGLPGLLGTAFLALAMFYSYLVGLAEVTEILLFFLGLALLVVEIFFLPGMVVFGATGFVCLVLSLILSRQTFVLPQTVSEEEILFFNLLQLLGLFVAVIVVSVLLWRLLPHIPGLRKLYLARAGGAEGSLSGTAVSPARAVGGSAAQVAVGSAGTAATVLRPAGVALIDGERVDVVADGGYIEAGQPIRVLEVHGNRVVVERAEAGGDADGARRGEQGNIGLIVLLGVLGLVFLVAEVFFVSFGVLSVFSGAALFGAVFLAFQESPTFGTAVLVILVVAAPTVIWGAFRILPHTRFGRALMLEGSKHDEVSGRAADPGIKDLLNKVGETTSVLRPAGFARIDGRKVDVVTRGEMIESGRRVRVVEVLGNRVVVKAESPEQ